MVRGYGKLKRSFRQANSWRKQRYDAELAGSAENPLRAYIGQSFSGKERNKLFFNRQARQFVDFSAISGLDNIADSRVLALWDFDRDGWQDLAVANANAPLLNIYRNELANKSAAGENGRMIALRFVGGSRSPTATSQLGCRDGYGAVVRMKAGNLNLVREHRCGEGMAGQNSATMFVGIGANTRVPSVVVRWPSGSEQRFKNVPAGTLLTVYENPTQSPNKSPQVRTAYVVKSSRRWTRAADVPRHADSNKVLHFANIKTDSSLILYTSMATWCDACKRHLPQLKQLRAKFNRATLEMYGVPIDEKDSPDQLTDYGKRQRPAYQLLVFLSDKQRRAAKEILADALQNDALPSSIITDANGQVLLVTAGLPTVSQLRQSLRYVRNRNAD